MASEQRIVSLITEKQSSREREARRTKEARFEKQDSTMIDAN